MVHWRKLSVVTSAIVKNGHQTIAKGQKILLLFRNYATKEEQLQFSRNGEDMQRFYAETRKRK